MRYLYYTLYRLMLQIKTNDTPDWNAMFLISIFEGINIQSILLLLPKSIENRYRINDQVLLFAIVPCVILFVINYSLYVKNARKIKSIYEGESPKNKTIGVIFLLGYTIGTLIALFYCYNLAN